MKFTNNEFDKEYVLEKKKSNCTNSLRFCLIINHNKP